MSPNPPAPTTSRPPTARPTVSVVVPVYNGAQNLPALVERLWPVLVGASRRFEIILVNDGSHDDSWPVIQQLSANHAQVRGIDLMRNYGQHNALLCGLRQARYAVIVTLDDDLQNPPAEIPRLLSCLESGPYDVVYGQPLAEQHEWWRRAASRFTKLALASVLGAHTATHVSSFRALRAALRPAFEGYQSAFVNIDVLLAWATTRITSVPVGQHPRHSGVSTYDFPKLVLHAVNMVTGFSTLPLQFASLLGFASTLFGLVVLVYVVGRYLLEGGSVPGFPFLASVIALFSGAQMLALGIMGEYLARMHLRLMARPTYAIREASAVVEPADDA